MLELSLDNSEYKCERYFSDLPLSLGIHFSRCMNHRLPIEYGRGFFLLERVKRTCKLCRPGDLGDEFHYLFKCSYLMHNLRKLFLLCIEKTTNVFKFHVLDVSLLTKGALFCKAIVMLLFFYMVNKHIM